MAIYYHTEDCKYNLRNKRRVSRWIADTAAEEGKAAGDISIVLCSDKYILDINKKHLQHDYYTDIITFDYSEGDTISGDLFISVDTVAANSAKYGITVGEELMRVIIHGILHLCGYKDKKVEEEKEMRAKENHYLAKRQF